MRFDNLKLPAGATLTRATLTLTTTTWTTGFKLLGYYLSSAWDPASPKLGWLNRTTAATWLAGGMGTADQLPNQPFSLSNFKGAGNELRTVDLDLSVVQGWISKPASNQGIVLGAVEVETQTEAVDPNFDDGSVDFSGAGWNPADYDLTGIVEPPPSQDHVTSRPSWYDAGNNSAKPGQLFAPGNPWNVDASQAPLDPNSAKVIQSLAQRGWGLDRPRSHAGRLFPAGAASRCRDALSHLHPDGRLLQPGLRSGHDARTRGR